MNQMDFFKKPRTLKEGYKRLLYWYKPFHSPRFIRALSFELYKWGHRENALSIEQFLLRYNIPPKLYFKWLSRYPELQVVHYFTLMGIGSRREDAALHWRIDSKVFMKSASYYSEVWRKCDEFREGLKHGMECIAERPLVYIDMPEAPEVVAQPEVQKTLPAQQAVSAANINKDIDSDYCSDIQNKEKYSTVNTHILVSRVALPAEYASVTH